MSRSESGWREVGSSSPCPVCRKPDWCSVSVDGLAVICMRRKDGSLKPTRNGGYLHLLGAGRSPGSAHRVRSVAISSSKPCRHDFPALARRFHSAVRPERLAGLAGSLGLLPSSLLRLGIGWASAAELEACATSCRGPGCWSFPMVDASGRVRGFRLRAPDGRKYAVAGGTEGLFVPGELTDVSRLLVSEGPTDCCALLDLGFATVGRPSCMGGVRDLVELVRRLQPAEIAIVADRDEPGLRGADALADELVLYCRIVRVVTPPAGVKDAREWKLSGATAADVNQVIEAAPVRRHSFSSRRIGRRRGK